MYSALLFLPMISWASLVYEFHSLMIGWSLAIDHYETLQASQLGGYAPNVY